MNIDAFEKREELRTKIIQAEERLSGAKTRSMSEARKELGERRNNIMNSIERLE